jgi:hypothetical protein
MMQKESEMACHWWALLPGSVLPLRDGGSVQIIFAGYPGGSAGPDVHDAVLYLAPVPAIDGELPSDQADKDVGDVEFHIRASDWEIHHHHTDVRYNRVILHVVLVCDRAGPTIRQDGRVIPICSLQDLSLTQSQVLLQHEHTWACQRLSIEECNRLLEQAGLLRFEQKVHAFVEQLHDAAALDEANLDDMCLIPALAEGLGYGRDRAFFRAAGLCLLGKSQRVPEPLGRALEPSPLDSARLRVLARLIAQWRAPSVWMTLRGWLLPEWQLSEMLLVDVQQVLREAFCKLGLSLARTDILICNVVLPFAAAVALVEHDRLLYTRAEAIYRQHPGLCSNRITRLMSEQLRLPEEPHGSCQQQGLHFIYQQTCREKRCEVCLMGKRDI